MSNFWEKIPKPFLVLAPMEDVTDYVFREIIATELPKPDVFFTEFTNADGLFSRGSDEVIKRFKFNESHRPIVAQIWGSNPDTIYKASKLISDLGFNGIDINMGCPVHAVVAKGAGAALCKTPELAKEIIDAAKKGSGGVPVSVKTRLGYDKVNTDEWISFLLKQDLTALTVHGRVAVEMSKFPANWDEIGKAVKLKNDIAPKTLIIGNGDIKSRAQAIEMHEKHGVDGIMIARGIFSNPWIFDKQEKTHSKEEYLAILKKHLALYDQTWRDTKSIDRMKKFFKMYITNSRGANKLRQKLMDCRSFLEFEQVLNNLAE